MPKPPLSEAEIQARLLYRDGLILILDKPAGLPVHAGPGGGPNLEQCFEALRFGLRAPPALAHRLDRDTSGCLVLGRHRKALAKLGRLFQEGKVDKTYWAAVVGSPPQPEGRIEAPLLAINSADDERNPPETGLLEREIRRVKNGRVYLIPASEETRGHGTTGMAKFWSKQVGEFLQSVPKRTM